MNKRTTIVGTIGPSSETTAVLASLMTAGLNVARLNFSHGTHQHHHMLVSHIRSAARQTHKTIAILADLQGPRLRLGDFTGEKKLTRGHKIVLLPEKKYPQWKSERLALPLGYPTLYRHVRRGQRIFVKDGLIELRVTSVRPKQEMIVAKVVTGGSVTARRGMNLPGANLDIPAVTVKDRADALFALELGVDWLALSFVGKAADVNGLRRYIASHLKRGQAAPKIMAKIETTEAVHRLDEIIAAADGIMIARGDLGIELPVEELPVLQKDIITKCRLADKPVIVATQMLESMMINPRPTRAEITDVANAVVDHTDAVMLSGETASGQYPVEAVKVMAKIIEHMERSHYDDVRHKPVKTTDPLIATAGAATRLALQAGAAAVVVFDTDGQLAQAISASRVELPVLAVTSNDRLAHQLVLNWGLIPCAVATLPQSLTAAARQATALLKKKKITLHGQPIVIVVRTKGEKARNIVEVVG